MKYTIVSKLSNSFGDLIVKVLYEGELHTLTFEEGSWPDALQLKNEIQYKVLGQ